MVKIKILTMPNAGEDVEQTEMIHSLLVEYKIVQTHEDSLAFTYTTRSIF